jgi:hypothetical protein
VQIYIKMPELFPSFRQMNYTVSLVNPCAAFLLLVCSWHTDKKENKIFLIYKEIQRIGRKVIND